MSKQFRKKRRTPSTFLTEVSLRSYERLSVTLMESFINSENRQQKSCFLVKLSNIFCFLLAKYFLNDCIQSESLGATIIHQISSTDMKPGNEILMIEYEGPPLSNPSTT